MSENMMTKTKQCRRHDNDRPNIDVIETNLNTRRQLALFRINLLDKPTAVVVVEEETEQQFHVVGNFGLPSMFLTILQDAVDGFLHIIKAWSSSSSTSLTPSSSSSLPKIMLLSDTKEFCTLVRVLSIYKKIAVFDPTLEEELGYEGAHQCLSRLLNIDATSVSKRNKSIEDNDGAHGDEEDANEEAVMEIHDRVCEVLLDVSSFPRKMTPLSLQELQARLPLVFNICRPSLNENDDDGTAGQRRRQPEDTNTETILINQVTTRQTAQRDVGYLMWPASVVLSRYIISHPDIVMHDGLLSSHPKTILEVGAGCGLVGLLAASLISKRKNGCFGSSVVLTDFNEVVVENLQRNILLNGLENIATADVLDFYEQGEKGEGGWVTRDGQLRDPVDLILASDVICQPEDAYAAARTIDNGLKSTGKALVVLGGSNHRFGVDKFEDACLQQRLILSKIDPNKYIRDELKDSKCNKESSQSSAGVDNDMEKCAGFSDVMTYSFWVVEKQHS